MSDLIAVAYPDQAAATRARDDLAEGARKGLVDVDDVIVIRAVHGSLSAEMTARLDAALAEAERSS